MKGMTKTENILIALNLYKFYNYLIEEGIVKAKTKTSPLFSRATVNILINHFNGSMGHVVENEYGEISLGYGMLHYSLIRMLKPERILCIGSQKGFIPAVCALACKDNRRGKVDFVDAGKGEGERGSWGGVGFWRKVDEKKHFSVFGLNKFIKLYTMTTRQFSKKYSYKYEYIYIDGDHSYPGVKYDYVTFWKRLTIGGYMSFHDIGLRGLHEGVEYGVWRLWHEVGGKNSFSFSRGDNTVGFLQKALDEFE